MRPQSREVVNHPRERPTRADALLSRHLLRWHTVDTLQLLPRSQGVDIERRSHPVGTELRKFPRRVHIVAQQPVGVAAAYAPYLIYREEFQGLFAFSSLSMTQQWLYPL